MNAVAGTPTVPIAIKRLDGHSIGARSAWQRSQSTGRATEARHLALNETVSEPHRGQGRFMSL